MIIINPLWGLFLGTGFRVEGRGWAWIGEHRAGADSVSASMLTGWKLQTRWYLENVERTTEWTCLGPHHLLLVSQTKSSLCMLKACFSSACEVRAELIFPHPFPSSLQSHSGLWSTGTLLIKGKIEQTLQKKKTEKNMLTHNYN